MNDLSMQHQTIAGNKRRCEAEMEHLKQEIDDLAKEARFNSTVILKSILKPKYLKNDQNH